MFKQQMPCGTVFFILGIKPLIQAVDITAANLILRFSLCTTAAGTHQLIFQITLFASRLIFHICGNLQTHLL